jgi:short chain dehydrogenase
VLITGATDGVGNVLARRLAASGARVLLHGRSDEKGEAAVRDIRRESSRARVEYHRADFASLDEVRNLAHQVSAGRDRLDLLINNAGIGFGAPDAARETSRDGYEHQGTHASRKGRARRASEVERDPVDDDDPYNLQRFVDAQAPVYTGRWLPSFEPAASAATGCGSSSRRSKGSGTATWHADTRSPPSPRRRHTSPTRCSALGCTCTELVNKVDGRSNRVCATPTT